MQSKLWKKETKPQITIFSPLSPHSPHLPQPFYFIFFFIDKVHFHILLLALRGLIRFSAMLFIHRHFSKSCMLYIANEKGGTTTEKKKLNIIHRMLKEKMEQWITLIPANTIILNSFKCKSNLLSISS